jgi:hypothetical protein
MPAPKQKGIPRMNFNRAGFIPGLAIVAGILASSVPAQATLGAGVDSVATDRKALSAVKRATSSRASYSIQESASVATVVREYLTPSNVVFAVAWNGLVPPDLSVLLGTYATEYREAKRQLPRRHGQRRTRVKGASVIVETWGHMRDLHGRAYLPALVPSGVDIDEIQ